MAPKGRKRKPVELHKRDGTHRKDRHISEADQVQVVQLTNVPAPPSYFNQYAITVYYLTAEELIAKGLLASIDANIFHAYCQEMGGYIEAQELLKTQDKIITIPKTGYQMPNPLIALSNKALKNAKDIAVLFGITPSARSSVTAATKKEKSKIASILELKKA